MKSIYYKLMRILNKELEKKSFSTKETDEIINEIKNITNNSKLTDLEKIEKIKKLVKSKGDFSEVKLAVDNEFLAFIFKWCEDWEKNYKDMTDKQKDLIEGQIENDINNVIKDYRGKYEYVKRWMATESDVGPCDFCSGLIGKEVGLTENWEHKGYKNLIPGSVHKGCRCYYIEIKRPKK
jgi:hypothetical protein